MSDLAYLLECVETHADKFPVPSHMQELVKRVRAQSANPVGYVDKNRLAAIPDNGRTTEPLTIWATAYVSEHVPLYLAPQPIADEAIATLIRELVECSQAYGAGRLSRLLNKAIHALTVLAQDLKAGLFADAFSAATIKEREEIANYLRAVALNYDQGSDGRNTFIIAANWVEERGQ